MPAFNYTALAAIKASLRELYHRRRSIAQLEITHEEYIQAFVPYEMRYRFQAVTGSIANTATVETVALPAFDGMFRLRLFDIPGHPVPPMVRNPTIQSDAPGAVVDRIRNWLAVGGDASREFGRALALIEHFNDNFTMREIRFYWPTIMTLTAMGADSADTDAKLRKATTPSNPKPLSHELKVACRLASETITAASLIPSELPPNSFKQATLSVMEGHEYDEPGLGRFYGYT